MITESWNIGTRRDVARQHRSKHVSAATNKHATIEELLEDVSCVFWASAV
jgi:hypothetical protein